MHLIQSFLNKSMTIVPTVIPEPIWAIANQATASSLPATPTSPVTRQHSGGSVSSSGATNLNTWIMSSSQKQQYSALFDNLDKHKSGRISGGEVANFLSTSKLSNDILAVIWELANINDDENFNKQEFAIAMYLVQKKLAGFELPEDTPQELIQSSTFSPIGSPQQSRQSSVNYTPLQNPPIPHGQQQQQQVAPPLPPQPGKSPAYPQQQQQQPIQKQNTHMDDLLDVFGPSTPADQPSQPAQAKSASPAPGAAPALTNSITASHWRW
ncbi:unnamed protein product [Ambrosiozyma monospora]|uniref:Unnamed protein product n=1 Tax=Ambrosiozyma monospora TaxID=43982 RepID=A0ACB5U386_AMBMO|nr:unnamed protein product [Ambrosiozyma monospora]